jgi:hypothetical protein
MGKLNIIDYKLAYDYYLECKDINKVQKHFKHRKELIRKEWNNLGLEYPIKRIYKTGYNLPTGPRINKSLDIDYFKIIDTEAKAYFLGLIAADGCVRIKKDKISGNSYVFSLSLQEQDKYILEILVSELKHFMSLKYYKSKKVKINSEGKTYQASPSWRIDIHNRVFVENLYNQGMHPRKSIEGFGKINIPKELQPHFIRGYFDGDGCIGVYQKGASPIVYICSKTTDILDLLASWFPKNIDTYKRTRKEGMSYLYIKRQSILPFWDFIKPVDYKLVLQRKLNKFELFRTYVEQSTLANSVNSGKGENPNPEPSTIEIL